MKKCVLYGRFSPRPKDDAGEETTTDSISVQFDHCMKHADKQNLEIIDSFKDEYASGRSQNGRPGLVRALNLVTKEKCVLMTYSLSRLARSTTDALQIAQRVEKAGGQLMTVKDHIDTSSPMGRFFFTMIAAIAEMEREWISERTSDAMLSHQAGGRRMSDRTPYGWVQDPEKPALLVAEPNEQEALKMMKRLKDEGLGNSAIAQKLAEEGFLPRSGRPRWDLSTLRRILKRL
jgi:DNA invertase Pin-like site-specific DNA recombinase